MSRDCITQQTMVKLIYYLKKGSSNRENILPAPIFSRQFHFLISYQNPMKCSFEHIAVSLLSGVCMRSNKLKCHYCRWTINQWWELRRICTKTRNTFHLNCPKCSTHIILYFRFFIVVKLSFRVRLFSVYYLSDTRLTVRVACSSSFLSIFRSFDLSKIGVKYFVDLIMLMVFTLHSTNYREIRPLFCLSSLWPFKMKQQQIGWLLHSSGRISGIFSPAFHSMNRILFLCDIQKCSKTVQPQHRAFLR